MTRFVISSNSSPISLSRYTRLRGGQVSNALRGVHPAPDSARPKDEQCESNAPQARSPQAKGRVERMAETFQDRLVTELRLADARTIGQTTAVLRDFLPRFNARFAVQPEHPEAAYRPVSPELCLSEILCFKHTRKVARDNTVKYHWRVLQLLPDRERPRATAF